MNNVAPTVVPVGIDDPTPAIPRVTALQ